jgi:hypothetical protein
MRGVPAIDFPPGRRAAGANLLFQAGSAARGGPLLAGCPGGAQPAWGVGSKPADLAAGTAAAEAEAEAVLMAAVLAVAPTRARRARRGSGSSPARPVGFVKEGCACGDSSRSPGPSRCLARDCRGAWGHTFQRRAPRPAAHRLSRPSHVRTCHFPTQPPAPPPFTTPRIARRARLRVTARGPAGGPDAARPARLLPAAAACCGGTCPKPGHRAAGAALASEPTG